MHMGNAHRKTQTPENEHISPMVDPLELPDYATVLFSHHQYLVVMT